MLKVEHVSIRYKLGDFKDIGLKEWVTRHLTGKYHIQEFMAVNDVSFEIERGDMLGIVGSNGSGKSTILKAVAQIMKPTKGTITVNGNVAALLELVSGFDGNLNIKENAYLRGAMLGYTKEFMEQVYDRIIEFAELKEFEERPFKQLSSGMQSRLAFSIASMVEPEILILDEVLSVGDGAFQAKSAEKMREIIAGGATTILVSHSLTQIRELCNKVLWLHQGHQVAFGEAQTICDQYQGFLAGGSAQGLSLQISVSASQKPYDYLIVGAGLTGAVFAHEAKKYGMKCLIIEKRRHIGGNVFTEPIAGIQVHKYGPHVFHTSNERVWNFILQFTSFYPYIHAPIAIYKNEIYNLPFNMNTYSWLWGIKTPEEAREKIKKQIMSPIEVPRNLEEAALCTIGKDIYEKLIQEYIEKQWGCNGYELPSSILKQFPMRFTYDNRYFDDKYQGTPIGGYTSIIEKMLEGTEVLLNTEYKDYIAAHPNSARKIIYTGSVDEYFDYSLGNLEYQSFRFESEEMNQSDYQGNAVVNYTSKEVLYTRTIEHKHFECGSQPTTIVTYEYPQEWHPGRERYYPINDKKNNELYQKYCELAEKEKNVVFAGRLGKYQYYNMSEAIAEALNLADREFS